MRTMKASEFETECLKLIDEVAQSGEPLVITKNGRPIPQLSPINRERRSIWGLHKGQIEILGDILEPIDADWEAERRSFSTLTAWPGWTRR
jgi:antitoxin (DNA-binding transcriptional repressor) of toxin-antitoxin stability system